MEPKTVEIEPIRQLLVFREMGLQDSNWHHYNSEDRGDYWEYL